MDTLIYLLICGAISYFVLSQTQANQLRNILIGCIIVILVVKLAITPQVYHNTRHYATIFGESAGSALAGGLISFYI